MIRLKNINQIGAIRDSGHLLFDTFKYIQESIKPGISTWDIDKLAEEFIIKNKGIPAFKNYAGFPASVCTAVNANVIHGIPSKKEILKDGDIVGVDIGINLNGYISDSANTYAVGTISEVDMELLDVTKKALEKAIEACVAGNRISDIGKAVTAVAKPYGYGIVHQYCGHGVGFDVHEDPQVYNNYPNYGKNGRIKPGMVLALEPMINLGSSDVIVLEDDWTVRTADSRKSAHFEHTVAIFKDRTEVLTRYE